MKGIPLRHLIRIFATLIFSLGLASSALATTTDDITTIAFGNDDQTFVVSSIPLEEDVSSTDVVSNNDIILSFFDNLGVIDYEEQDLNGKTLKGSELTRAFVTVVQQEDNAPYIMVIFFVADDSMVYIGGAVNPDPQDKNALDPLLDFLVDSIAEGELADIPRDYQEIDIGNDEEGTPDDDPINDLII